MPVLKYSVQDPHIKMGRGRLEVSNMTSRYTVNASTFLIVTAMTFAPHIALAAKIIGNG